QSQWGNWRRTRMRPTRSVRILNPVRRRVVRGAIMGFWSRLFDGSPPMPPQGRTFEDRPPVKRVYYYFQHNALREAAFHPGHPNLAGVIAAGRFGSEQARYFWAKATHRAVQAGTIPPGMIAMLSDAAARALLESGVATVAAIDIRTRCQNGFT